MGSSAGVLCDVVGVGDVLVVNEVVGFALVIPVSVRFDVQAASIACCLVLSDNFRLQEPLLGLDFVVDDEHHRSGLVVVAVPNKLGMCSGGGLEVRHAHLESVSIVS